MMAGGDLRRVFQFWKKTDGNDGFGGVIPGAGPPAMQFETRGRIEVLSGDQMLINGGLNGVTRAEITIRQQPKAKLANTTWWIINKHDGRRFNIKLMNPDQKGAFITFIAEEGKP